MSGVTVRDITKSEKSYWDEQVQAIAHVHPFNAFDWGEVRRVDGWAPVHLVAERAGTFCGAILLLMKKLPLVPFHLFYAPHGPICAPDDEETFRAIHERIASLARARRAIFLRIDPNIREEDARSFERIASRLGYRHLEQRWTYWNGPRDEYRIDLTQSGSVEELHGALDRDTRRCIRKGPKDGLTIAAGDSEEDLRAFYDIFREFSVAKGFMARAYEYQKQLREHYVSQGRGRLFLAQYEGNVIGGLLCVMFGRKCVAMHMGTPYRYQKLQPNYAYVWESIRWAKEHGCEWYSFRGVGTTPTQEAFKRKFNPRVVALAGYFDYPFRPLLYRVFNWAEFTLLPSSWPVLAAIRKAGNGAMKWFVTQPRTT